MVAASPTAPAVKKSPPWGWILLAFVAIGVAVWGNWDRTLDALVVLAYVQALAWPVVVGATLYWLRYPLRLKMEQLLKVGIGNAIAEFEKSNLETQAEAIKILAEPEPSAPREPQPSAPREPQPSAPREPQPSAPREPEPELQPGPEPEPSAPRETEAHQARDWATSRPVSVSRSEQVRRLEAEIRKLELDVANPFLQLNSLNNMATQSLLRRLKARLSSIDPNSPYAN